MKCDQCPRDLADGDEAYIQEFRQITVRGTKVRESIIDRIVCADCAAPPPTEVDELIVTARVGPPARIWVG